MNVKHTTESQDNKQGQHDKKNHPGCHLNLFMADTLFLRKSFLVPLLLQKFIKIERDHYQMHPDYLKF